MGFWDFLQGLLPDSLIEIDQSKTNVNIVKTGEGHSLTAVSEEDEDLNVLNVDTDSLSQQETSELIAQAWAATGELFVETSQRDKKAIESAVGDPRIEDILDFYSHLLDERRFGMLKAALFLREAWEGGDREISRSDMRSRKRDIAERFGEEAYSVSNLVSAGYFDEGGHVRQLFEELVSEPESDPNDYIKLFDEVVTNQPFTVFVGQYDTVTGIKAEVKSRLRKKQQYGIHLDFIDIRGIAEDNRRKVRQAVEQLGEEAEDFKSETVSEWPERVERLYIENISGLLAEGNR